MPWDRPRPSEINDFINKLLTSEKFDELAEKIAEKAAKKIMQIEKANTMLRHGDQFENDQNLAKVNDLYNNKAKLARYDKKIRNTKDMYETKDKLNTMKDDKFNYRFDDELIKKDYKNTDLTLNFKHLLKQRNIDITKVSNMNTDDYKSKANNSDLEKEKISLRDVRNRVSTSNEKEKSNSEEINNTKYENVNDANDLVINKESKDAEDVENESEQLSEENLSQHNKSINTDDIKAAQRADLKDIKSNEEYSNTEISEVNTLTQFMGKPLRDVNKTVKEDEKEDSSKEKIEEDSSKEKIEEVSSKKKRVVRKEGNKVYTYNSSSDYKEYHEDLESLKSKKKKSVI